MKTIEDFLLAHNVKPTAVRVLVWNEVQDAASTFTLSDMEAALPIMDRSSIFRTLRLFCQHHMLHEINDGSGFQKYCRCRCSDADHHLNHIHFTCKSCGETFCLEEYSIPVVELPEGFKIDDVEYVVKGLCQKCSK